MAPLRLLTRGSAFRVVHVSCHGRFHPRLPTASSLELADGALDVAEILHHLRLDAELVTLSGCGTGMNVVMGGDELIGLVRGLLYAGAQTLLVSLWEVEDQSTAEFMLDFYTFYPPPSRLIPEENGPFHHFYLQLAV